jgi:hypothetical protein
MDEEIINGKAEEGKGLKRLWWFTGGGAILLLLIVSAVLWRVQAEGWDFSWPVLTGKPVAVVNGEEVSRAAFRERLAVSRGMLERQYGKGLYSGEEGKGILAELEADVLERMIQERLVGQEGKRLNICITDAQVRQEIEAVGKEVYGSPENFLASLKEEGISPEYLFGHIGNLLLRKEVDKAKLATAVSGGEPVGYWLAQARQEAKVDIYKTAGFSRAGGAASCCGSGGAAGGTGSEASQKGPAPDLKNEAAAAGLEAYRKSNPAAKDARAKVTDYGCHMQVDIEQAGKLVKSYIYQNGVMTAL